MAHAPFGWWGGKNKTHFKINRAGKVGQTLFSR